MDVILKLKLMNNEKIITINENLKIGLSDISEIKLVDGNGICDRIIFKMPEISLESVVKTYNGKPGCMCGCNGKYSYLKSSQEFGSKDRGYVVNDDEINERSVNYVLNKLKNEAHLGIEVIDDYIFSLDIGNRRYSLYLRS